MKELSTILEADSTLTSVGSVKEKGQHAGIADSSDDSMPDVLSEMLSRRLITSPPPWLKEKQNCSCPSSPNSPSNSSRKTQKSNDIDVLDANYFTFLEHKSEELSQIFREDLKSITSKVNLPSLIINTFSKLGKNPSEVEIEQAFKKMGLRWLPRNGNQLRRSTLSLSYVDVNTTNFHDQVYNFFKGLTLDSPLEDLEKAFQKIGIVCPDCSLRRNSNAKSVSFSPSTVGNSSESYEASTSTGSALLPPIPTSISISTEDLSLSQDMELSSKK